VRVARFLLFALAACGTDVDLGGTAPTTGDGGVPVDHCGTLVAPSVDGGCHACSASSSDCQANGCYGGYWCDTSSVDCHTPPKTCP
jgi:hypothetical protein